MDERYRRIYLNIATITTMPSRAREYTECIDVASLMDFLRTEVLDAGNAYSRLSRSGRVIRIREIANTKDGLVLLTSSADPNSGDPVFEHLLTGDQRVEPKNKDEGVGASAHMAFCRTPIHVGAHSKEYVAALEWGLGLGRTALKNFLNKQLRQVVFEYDDDHGETKEAYYKIDLNPLASESLMEKLEKGRPLAFELIHNIPKSDKFDESSRIEKRRERVRWQAGSGVMGRQFIRKIAERCRGESDYNTISIEYRDGETGKKTTESFPIAEDLMNQMCSKSVRVDLEAPLGQSVSEIREELAVRMIEEAVAEARSIRGRRRTS